MLFIEFHVPCQTKGYETLHLHNIMRSGSVTKIVIGWAIVTTGGLYSFVLSKQSVDKHRYEAMKVRERIRRSNEGEYDSGPRKFTG